MTEKIFIDWPTFHQDVRTLAQKIRTRQKFERIIAVSRGGLIPAGILAYELGIRDCTALNVCSYDDEQARSSQDIEISSAPLSADTQTLIVDDLSDSGRTLKLLQKSYPQAVTAVVYAKQQSLSAADIVGRQLPDRWVVFPWD